MGHREDIARLTPALRRFAHALVLRDDPLADDLVLRTIEGALAQSPFASLDALRQSLYCSLLRLHHERLRNEAAPARPSGPPARGQGVTASLLALSTEDREALLLVVLEGFTYAQSSDILGVTRSALACRIARARLTLGTHLDAALSFDARRHLRSPSHLKLVK